MSAKTGSSPNPNPGPFGRRSFLAGASALALSGCSFIPRESFTAQEQAIAEVPGIPNARIWMDANAEDVRAFLASSILGEGRAESFDVLALSGGAFDGAYGAGVIGGWTRLGNRPKFAFVTGVSAGALLAPLAFLGPGYDAIMQRAFSVDAAQMLGDLGSILTLLGSTDLRHGMLQDLVDKFIDDSLLEAVAAEHARGRRLYILTTNLDAQRGVIWDMGAVARGGPQYRTLFRDILVGSASIPGLFGPTFIEVHANGRLFREMHVDGGATSQFFVLPDVVFIDGPLRSTKSKPRIWVVMNNHILPQFEVVQPGILSTISRSFSTLIKSDAKSVLLASGSYFGADRFHLTFIDQAFDDWLAQNPDISPGFNTPYMQALYHYGYQKALSPYLWSRNVPLPDQGGRKVFRLASSER